MKISPNDSRRILDDNGLEVARFRDERDAAWYVQNREPTVQLVELGDELLLERLALLDARNRIIALENELAALKQSKPKRGRPSKIITPDTSGGVLNEERLELFPTDTK